MKQRVTKCMKRLCLLLPLLLFAVVINAQTYSDEDLNVSWSMNNGSTSTATANPASVIQSTSWSVASDLAIEAKTGTYFEKTFTLFTSTLSDKHKNDRSELNNSYVEFKFKPVAGLTITPTELSFDIIKIGTSDPNIWVECVQGSTTTSIAENIPIRRNDQDSPSESQSYNLTTKTTITASDGETIFRIYIGKLANNKQVGIANVVVKAKVNGTVQKFTTVYNIPAELTTKFEGNTGSLAATTSDAAANAPELQVDATNGKLGVNNSSWAQINSGTVLTLPGVPQGATVTFVLYNSTALTINGVVYTNGQTYTATKDENLAMTCTTDGYIQSITVVGSAFVTVLDTEGYTNTWFFGKSNGSEEFALQKSPEYTYTVNERSLVINTASGKLDNSSRTDQWAQCNDGTLFKVPVYKGSKLSWGKYGSGSDAGFTINGKLYNDYYIATEDGTVEMTAKGVSYLSFIKIEPASLYEATGTIAGGTIDGSYINLNAAGNGQTYSAQIASAAFTVVVPADTYTFDLSEDAPYVVSDPENKLINADGSIGTITITAAQPQTVTGTIANAPAEAFTLTFTGTSHNKQVECAANATSYEVTLNPDTYVISSSVGTLSTLSQSSFKVLKAAASHNIYFPEAAVPAATSQNITVDNTATVAANVYNTVTDALAAAKAGSISAPIITLTSGQTYQEQVKVDMPDVTFKTSGAEKATITFYYGIGYTYYSLGEDGYYSKDRANTRNSILMKDPSRWGATVLVTNKGKNFKADNIRFENSFNQRYTTEEVVDGVRPNGAQSINYDRTLASDATGFKAADAKAVTERAAAIAFENNPTGCELYNCEFIGSQDTFYSSGTLYVKNCSVIGNTDYIFGGGNIVFDNCDLVIGGYSDKEASAYITANNPNAGEYYIFRDCTVKSGGRTYVLANLGRDWGGEKAGVYFFNLKNEIGDKLKYSWTNMNGAVAAGTANLHIYDFDPAVNANYNTTGATGANVNGLVSDDDAFALYTGVKTRLGFTPEHFYGDVTLTNNGIYNAVRIAANYGGEVNVTLADRQLYADRWNTICVPFSMSAAQIAASPLNGATIKEIDKATISGGVATISFKESTSIEAGKPYIIKGVALNNPVFEGVTISSTEAGTAIDANNKVTFHGTYLPFTLTANDKTQLYLTSNKLFYPTAALVVNAFRGYFTLSDAVTANDFVLDFGDNTTGIRTWNTEQETMNNEGFDLQGRRVTHPTKGLYIMNGKKVIIK